MSARGDGSRRAAAASCRVSLSNRQRAVAVHADRIRRAARRILAAARPEGGELSVVLVDDAAIAELNGAYRGKLKPTDVLSFSQMEGPAVRAGFKRGRGFAAAERGGVGGIGVAVPPTPIGDVVISVETARRQARERGRPLDEEIGALLVHGVLHLLGYDHERSAAAAREMFAREREVAAAAGLPAAALGDRPRRPARRAAPARRAQGGQA